MHASVNCKGERRKAEGSPSEAAETGGIKAVFAGHPELKFEAFGHAESDVEGLRGDEAALTQRDARAEGQQSASGVREAVKGVASGRSHMIHAVSKGMFVLFERRV